MEPRATKVNRHLVYGRKVAPTWPAREHLGDDPTSADSPATPPEPHDPPEQDKS